MNYNTKYYYFVCIGILMSSKQWHTSTLQVTLLQASTLASTTVHTTGTNNNDESKFLKFLFTLLLTKLLSFFSSLPYCPTTPLLCHSLVTQPPHHPSTVMNFYHVELCFYFYLNYFYLHDSLCR